MTDTNSTVPHFVSSTAPDYPLIFGEAVWEEIQQIVALAKPNETETTMQVQLDLPVGVIRFFASLARAEAKCARAQGGNAAAPASEIVAPVLEEILIRTCRQSVEELIRGEHPIVRAMAEKAGTYRPDLDPANDAYLPEGHDFDDDIPF